MKTYLKTVAVLALAVMFLFADAYSGRKREISESFEGIKRIKIETVSGDCVIKKGETDKVEVEVINSYSPRDSFEPKLRERGKTLRLIEQIRESNSGSSTWIVTAPDDIEISFSTASGDMTIQDLSCEVNVSTASGDINIENCTGIFEISTASGDVEIYDSEGEFQLSTASGTVEASGITIDEASIFSTASGRVEVSLAESAEHDLELSSASGRAILNFGGNPIKGHFEFTAKVRGGRIDAPYDFDEEEKFRRWGDRYVRKAFTRGSDSPEISISTASGRAVLKEG
jgi:DUF4097 and DUF4098 domain-containing protein YvlB